MNKQKAIGGMIAFLIVTLLALPFHWGGTPIPSSYVELLIVMNAIIAFVSIFIQRVVIILYELNVFEKTTSVIDYTFKYFAMYSLGMNYHVQLLCNRLPFILNKLMALIFFLFMIWIFFSFPLIF
ncbi:MAG: hypothetical protein ACI4XL_12770 [Bacillus sp. (in: firmicutes)]